MKFFAAGEGGAREVLHVAYPLILSTASNTVMQFINRVFLARYSPEALAACVPAGVLAFTLLCFFMGTATYTNAFVSQYHGRGKAASISVAVWQGVWFSLLSGVVLIALIPLGNFIISNSGHDPSVIALEKPYFTILTSFAAMPVVLNTALAAFFIGRGRTMVPMVVTIAGNALCILISWLLIFGQGPFPELGIRGAAWASVAGQALMTLLYIALIFSPYNRRRYRTARLVGLHRGLFKRLIRFGAPNGLGFFLEIASFSVFIFIVGGLDKISLAANNIIAAINMIAFMPIVGLGLATLTLVGKYIGMRKPDVSVKVAYSAANLAALYALSLGALFVLVPGLFINIFGSGHTAEYAEILDRSRPIMNILAVFIFFNARSIVFSDALRGAGDTRFQMLAALAGAWILFVPGIWYIVHRAGGELAHAWAWDAFYMALLSLFFWLRFRSGLWRKIDILKG